MDMINLINIFELGLKNFMYLGTNITINEVP